MKLFLAQVLALGSAIVANGAPGAASSLSELRHARRTLTQREVIHDSNWAGVALLGDEVNMFGSMSATWTVPDVTCAQNFPGDSDFQNIAFGCGSSQWVGTGGLNDTSMLQAGVSVEVSSADGENTPNYHVWWQWFPADPVVINEFQVDAGDIISILLTFIDPASALITISNQANDVQRQSSPIQITVHAPSSESGLNLQSVQCMTEYYVRQAVGASAMTVQVAPIDFGHVTFSNIDAWGPDQKTHYSLVNNPALGVETKLVDIPADYYTDAKSALCDKAVEGCTGYLVTQTTILSSSSFETEFLGFK